MPNIEYRGHQTLANTTEPCQCNEPIHISDQLPDAPLFMRLRWHEPKAIREIEAHGICFGCNRLEHQQPHTQEPCDREDIGSDCRCSACIERAVDAAEYMRDAAKEDGIDWSTLK